VLVEVSVVEQRYDAVKEVLADGASVAEVARRCGLSLERRAISTSTLPTSSPGPLWPREQGGRRCQRSAGTVSRISRDTCRTSGGANVSSINRTSRYCPVDCTWEFSGSYREHSGAPHVVPQKLAPVLEGVARCVRSDP
jgi:hypothetical protein